MYRESDAIGTTQLLPIAEIICLLPRAPRYHNAGVLVPSKYLDIFRASCLSTTHHRYDEPRVYYPQKPWRLKSITVILEMDERVSTALGCLQAMVEWVDTSFPFN
ncbi:hypothetical protein E1B28_005362 [Marasmius oreades]|uniref:Uncharacterized protein n=1 Tax=Marasmius oreades TaxID=181124 RepID=A0A9P7UW40_9AGAR|nr:uncharacterized protein E1B28_005362 [Marasmius oreades]KAG7094534.1 hypothetical protein E1B28_005362 [Marasmius oreades]